MSSIECDICHMVYPYCKCIPTPEPSEPAGKHCMRCRALYLADGVGDCGLCPQCSQEPGADAGPVGQRRVAHFYAHITRCLECPWFLSQYDGRSGGRSSCNYDDNDQEFPSQTNPNSQIADFCPLPLITEPKP